MSTLLILRSNLQERGWLRIVWCSLGVHKRILVLELLSFGIDLDLRLTLITRVNNCKKTERSPFILEAVKCR